VRRDQLGGGLVFKHCFTTKWWFLAAQQQQQEQDSALLAKNAHTSA
jgi:hypothetical protein